MQKFCHSTIWFGVFIIAGCNGDSNDTSQKIDSGISSDETADSELGRHDDAGPPRVWPDGKYISVDEVYERLVAEDPDMLLVNVVDEIYYDLGHLDGSLKITWDTIADHLGAINPKKHVVIYCRRGVRSESAYDTLTQNDYALIWIMEGGVEAWTAKGYPTVPD